MSYPFFWVVAVPNTPGDIAAGDEFARLVLRQDGVRPDLSDEYASPFSVGRNFRTTDGVTRTHLVAGIAANEAMRIKALTLLGTGAYPTLLFRVVPDAGVQPGDPPYYVADMDAAFASLGLSELPSGDEGLVP